MGAWAAEETPSGHECCAARRRRRRLCNSLSSPVTKRVSFGCRFFGYSMGAGPLHDCIPKKYCTFCSVTGTNGVMRRLQSSAESSARSQFSRRPLAHQGTPSRPCPRGACAPLASTPARWDHRAAALNIMLRQREISARHSLAAACVAFPNHHRLVSLEWWQGSEASAAISSAWAHATSFRC